MSHLKKRGISQYGQVATSSEVAYASPHRLVQMLMEGALDKMAAAKGFIQRKDMGQKSRHISWALSIINGLRGALDLESGGDIARNLDDLYEYMGRRLMAANSSNDPEILDEVASLLTEIKLAWDALPDEVKQLPQEKISPAVGA
ncbi:flagellar biosynthesis protein FliS [Candidatus Endoriftia persephone str. Guaymas]|nr:flagellar export chaperone FliS [Candidatus Endoriftia persephone]EGV49849.1 flagellar protein fliS [endosymbiont of Riftia pachyptila (vent Ph05)]MBA1330081.1 flagellar biosynthesis protein FliS [Candidatus Endoriftia persephone str. Guaymas]USF88141.1 flagellar export chaperone FliS [Candidatus Endoriftia persephone]